MNNDIQSRLWAEAVPAPERTLGMSRRYIHPTTMPGASSIDDAVELRRLFEHAANIGITAQDMEDELVMRTGFGDAVRNWVQENQTPNGMLRKIILNSAKAIAGSVETGGGHDKKT